MKKLLLLLGLGLLSACGSSEPKSKSGGPVIIVNNGTGGGSNNGATNNGQTNNGATNNGVIANNGVENNATAAPKILTFDANVREITQGDTVTFTAIVTDPDGIDDLIGGTLNDAASDRPYGSFSTAAAEGAYSLTLSWNEVHSVEPITFTTSSQRQFRAKFFDVAGNTVTQSITIELNCEGRQACDGSCGYADCEGACVDDNFASLDHCGSCGNSCPIGADCDGTSCSCAPSADICNNECVNLSRNDEHCGECDNACSCEAGLCFCSDNTDCGAGEECVYHKYGPSSARQSCITYGGFRIAGGGKSGFLEINVNGMWIAACDHFASTSYTAANLACNELFGTAGSTSDQDAMETTPWIPGVFCPDGATSVDDCEIQLDRYCTFADYVYVTCE